MCWFGQFDNLMVLMFFLDMVVQGARGERQTTTISSRATFSSISCTSHLKTNRSCNMIFFYVQPLQIKIFQKIFVSGKVGHLTQYYWNWISRWLGRENEENVAKTRYCCNWPSSPRSGGESYVNTLGEYIILQRYTNTK